MNMLYPRDSECGKGERNLILSRAFLIGFFLIFLVLPALSQEALWKELNDKALKLYQQGQYTEAVAAAKEALWIAQKTFGENHPHVAESAYNLAASYKAKGRYADAEPLYKRALSIDEAAFGGDHPLVATDLNNLALLYKTQGRYSDAEPLYERALAIREKTLSPKDPSIAVSLNNLAMLYNSQGKLDKAELLFKKALALWEEALGPDHPDVATCSGNLAVLYTELGRHSQAEPLLKRVLAVHEKTLGPRHPDVAADLNNLASLYVSCGKYSEGELLHKRALAVVEKALGPNHPEVAVDLNNLAFLYKAQGRFSEAEACYKRALALREKYLPPEHPDVAASLNNLASLYKAQGSPDKAEPLWKKALAIMEKALGPDHPSVATILNNLATLSSTRGKYEESELLQRRALAIREKALGPDHPLVASSVNNLALLSVRQGKLDHGETLYKQALAIMEKTLGPDHPDVAAIQVNRGLLFASQDNPGAALPPFRRALVIQDKVMENVFESASEREKFVFLETTRKDYESFLSLALRELRGAPDAPSAALDAVLRRKGIVVEALSREREALLFSNDPDGTKKYERLRQVSSQLAALSLSTPPAGNPEPYRERIRLLEAEKETLDKDLTRLSGVYRSKKRSRKADARAVAEALPSGSVLIEYVCTPRLHINAKGTRDQWGEYYYSALALPSALDSREKGIHPVPVVLGEAPIIDAAVEEFRKEMARAPRLVPLGEGAAEKRISAKGSRLYDLVVAPVLKVVGERAKLFIAPDGELNLIPFAALAGPDGQYLGEIHPISYLSSGRDLLRYEGSEATAEGAVIVADPDYDMSEQERAATARRLAGGNRPLALRSAERPKDLASAVWVRLPGTRQEGEAIKQILRDENPRLYLGKDAIEETAKKLRSPHRVHFATHGFFLEAMERPRGNDPGNLALPQNPLLRSGLIMSGANRTGRATVPEGCDDGILTALEVSALPLWNTDLVVLSACETGLGETRVGEGVFGLRRAFQLAGARTVVMSLWKVPDKETRYLMLDFYRRLKSGKGKGEALHEAQQAMIQARRGSHGAAHPFFWGAFVCVGEP